MKYWTYAEIKTKVEQDLGIEQEEFISATELLGYCNAGIDKAEAEIHTIYEDYFLSKTDIFPVANDDTYSLPLDIYANKIRGIMFKNQNLIYPMRRIRFNDKFNDIMQTNHYDVGSDYYRYLLINRSAAEGVQIEVVPMPLSSVEVVLGQLATPPLAPNPGDRYLVISEAVDAWVTQEGKVATWSGSAWIFTTPIAKMRVWYFRNANRLELLEDVCDIPEFVHFVIQYMKLKIYEKEGNPNMGLAKTELEEQRRQMVSTLSSMVPDGDNEIEKDLSHYEDMSYDSYDTSY